METMSERTVTPTPRSILTPAIAIVAAVAVVSGYVDLRVQIARLEGEVTALQRVDVPPTIAPPSAPVPPAPPVVSPPNAPVAAPVATPPWQCDGALNGDAVRALLSERGREVFACYEQGLAANPNLGSGNVVVELRVDPGGGVGELRSNGSITDPALLDCVRARISAWRFDSPGRGCAVVTLPFRFGGT